MQLAHFFILCFFFPQQNLQMCRFSGNFPLFSSK